MEVTPVEREVSSQLQPFCQYDRRSVGVVYDLSAFQGGKPLQGCPYLEEEDLLERRGRR